MGFGGIPYFTKMDSLHVKQRMGIIQLLAKRLLICYKGCETAAVVEQYAQVVCSRNGWDAGLITPYASVRGLGESPFHNIGFGFSLT
jgi:hypothetical protein